MNTPAGSFKRKQHGPGFTPEPEPVRQCADCKGEGLIKGIFHLMPCTRCNGGGFVLKETGDPLPPEEQVIYLRSWLKRSQAQCRQQADLIKSLEPYRKAKAAADLSEAVYPEQYKRNRRGGHGD